MELIASLKTFLRVAETGSFSAVASELGLAPSIVSRQLRSLEEHLGTRLIHRNTRAVSVTEEGRNLIPLARQTLDAADAFLQSAYSYRDAPSGRVRLGVPMALGLHLGRHLPDLLEHHQGLSIDLVLHDSAANPIDTGLDLDIRIGPIADSTLITRRLGWTSACLVASPGYLRGRSAPMHPNDLLGHECITYHDGQKDSVWRFSSAEGELAVTVRGRVRANNVEALRRTALAGLGITLLTDVQIDDDIREGRLTRLLPDYPPLGLPLSVVYPSRQHLPLRTRVVLEFLNGLYKADPAIALRVTRPAAPSEYANDSLLERVSA